MVLKIYGGWITSRSSGFIRTLIFEKEKKKKKEKIHVFLSTKSQENSCLLWKILQGIMKKILQDSSQDL